MKQAGPGADAGSLRPGPAQIGPAQSGQAQHGYDWQSGGFGLYLHWPFCQSKCPYCDFNSHVAARIDQTRWRDAYLSELDRMAAQTEGRVLSTVFFGGGTPSLMEPDTVSAIIERIRRNWRMSNDPEITLEANPGSVEAGRFRAYRQAGVTRVSMGVQALNDPDLRRLGRLHSVAEARAAFDIARTTFDRVSFDLIYARQGQSLQSWGAELREALSMAVDHLSMYQLTIEPGTAFGDRQARGGLRDLPDDDIAADMYDLTQDICTGAGMPPYEVSNHAAEGAESRHNQIYWRGGDWIGIGPGAHGRITNALGRHATDAVRAPGDWLARAERQDPGIENHEILQPTEAADEYLLMGLRLSEGIDTARYARMGGTFAPGAVDELQGLDLIRQDQGRISTTQQGRLLLNSVIRRLSGA